MPKDVKWCGSCGEGTVKADRPDCKHCGSQKWVNYRTFRQVIRLVGSRGYDDDVVAYDEQKISRLSDELSKLGYWDDYQNRVALTQSKHNLKNAVSLIAQGRVPDLETGGLRDSRSEDFEEGGGDSIVSCARPNKLDERIAHEEALQR